jgi:hypothetical protein
MKARLLSATLVAFLVFAPPALAQDSPQPGTVVVRYFECDLGATGEAIQFLNGNWRQVANELVEEGMLFDYGILTHAWGDEWNVVDYFVTESQPAFQEAWGELLRRLAPLDPDGEGVARFTEICRRHKDNIYGVVPPPSEN